MCTLALKPLKLLQIRFLKGLLHSAHLLCDLKADLLIELNFLRGYSFLILILEICGKATKKSSKVQLEIAMKALLVAKNENHQKEESIQ